MSELDNDVNYQAYLEAMNTGQFKELSKVAWVLFIDGKYAGTAETRDEILNMRPGEGGYIHQPNAPERVVHIPTPLSIE